MLSNRPVTIVCLLVAFITLAVFLPALSGDFISFDDPEYVVNNPLIRGLGPANLAAMFSQAHVGWWMPLTWLSLALDYHFWSLNPVGYHLTNILLHAVNAGLVVLIAAALLRMSRAKGDNVAGYYAALLFAGLFFGIHPLRVESVAWVSERKDVLNGLFAFAAILFYLQYVEKLEAGRQTAISYSLAVICFCCSLMAKSTSVVLPVMLLVLDWAPLGRFRRNGLRPLLMEKAPFLAASAVMVAFTLFFAAQSRYLVTYEVFPLGQRLAVSGNAIWEYVRMLLFPLGLSPFNVIPDPVPVSYGVKALLVAIALVWAGFVGLRRHPRLAAGTLCFILPLLPVLAFFQNGDQSYADRFTYLPSLATAIFPALIISGSSFLAGPQFRRGLAAFAALLVVTAFAGVTYRQLAVWKSTETFWTRIIQVEPLAITYKERGRYYHAVGRYAEAAADFSAALERLTPTLKPYEYNFYAFRGESLLKAGKYADAERDFTAAIGLHPHPVYYFRRGLALQGMGRAAEAEDDFRRAGPDPGPVAWFD